MVKKFTYLVIILLSYTKLIHGQSFILEKDPGIKTIIPENAYIDKLADGFMFTEGPVWSKEGFLLFTDIPANKILKWHPTEGLSTFLEPSGNTNGLAFDAGERLVLCQHSERQVAYYRDSSYETLVDNYEGNQFNSPNDLTISKTGIIYFTDPAWGLAKQEKDPAKELAYQGVFMIKDNVVSLVDNELSSPNGIALSPDGKSLYVANLTKGSNKKTWWKYKVNKDGTTKGKKLFADLSSSLEKGSPDGMKVDIEGNLYCTGPGGVWIINDKGLVLGLIRFPEIPANCCFGGPERKTLFVTARTGLYKIDLNIPGL